ncbi:MAG TPA: acyl-ACP--UDP-N-acetylglucosamine O-acyltransferase, partial [Thermoanaerobaculia bacterium]|nr:acyl-ACP--UDP-N-acetylglucosamine O-acyltransferase [Thermoanaerobaculia bacterium]
MTVRIHPTAVVDPSAELGEGVVVGPLAVVGPGVTLGPGCEVGGQAQVQGPSRFGRDNRIFPHACVGFEPQDLKYKGEEVRLEVGDRNHFRELTTIHRGTAGGGGVTTIGSDNLFMAYSHVAHDCHVGDRTVFVNGATLAGHVEVGDDAVIGAYSAVHQFCRVGRHAYVGGYTVVTMDALPYSKTVGQKATYYGLNTIGLRRKGFTRESVARLEEAMKLLVHSGLNTGQAIERIEAELGGEPEIDDLLAYLRAARRGVIKTPPGRRGERGGGGGVVADDGDDGAALAGA